MTYRIIGIQPADLPSGVYRIYPADLVALPDAIDSFLQATGRLPTVTYVTSSLFWMSLETDALEKENSRAKIARITKDQKPRRPREDRRAANKPGASGSRGHRHSLRPAPGG